MLTEAAGGGGGGGATNNKEKKRVGGERGWGRHFLHIRGVTCCTSDVKNPIKKGKTGELQKQTTQNISGSSNPDTQKKKDKGRKTNGALSTGENEDGPFGKG